METTEIIQRKNYKAELKSKSAKADEDTEETDHL